DDRVQAAADAEAEHGLEDRDPGRRLLVPDQRPDRPAHEQAHDRADQAVDDPRVIEARRLSEGIGSVPQGATNDRTLQDSDKELDPLWGGTRKYGTGKPKRGLGHFPTPAHTAAPAGAALPVCPPPPAPRGPPPGGGCGPSFNPADGMVTSRFS